MRAWKDHPGHPGEACFPIGETGCDCPSGTQRGGVAAEDGVCSSREGRRCGCVGYALLKGALPGGQVGTETHPCGDWSPPAPPARSKGGSGCIHPAQRGRHFLT